MDPSRCRATEGRVKLPSSNLMPANLFSSPSKLKKREGEKGRAQSGQFLALTSRNNSAGASTTASVSGQWLWDYPAAAFNHRDFVPRRLGQNPVVWGSAGFYGALGLREQRGVWLWSRLHPRHLQYLCVCHEGITKPMVNLCPGPLRKSAVKSNVKNPNCKALFYCLFSTFLTWNSRDV